MKKIFPLLIAIFVFTGCASKLLKPGEAIEGVNEALSDSIDMTTRLSSGILYILVGIEVNSNISSLFIDKTKEKVVSFHSANYEELSKGKSYYILPARITREGKTYYDEETARLLRNYFFLSGFGKPVEQIQNADYIIVTRIKESIEKGYDKNSSTVSMSIMTKSDIPVFTTTIMMESKSDINFWYYPTKRAVPSSTLSMKALGQVLSVALPRAYGVAVGNLEKFEKSMQDKAKNKQDKEKSDLEEAELKLLEDKRDAIKKAKEKEKSLEGYLNNLEEKASSKED